MGEIILYIILYAIIKSPILSIMVIGAALYSALKQNGR